MKAEDLIDDFVAGWRKQNNNDAAVYSSYHYDAMIAFAEVYHQRKVNNIVSDDVSCCLTVEQVANKYGQTLNCEWKNNITREYNKRVGVVNGTFIRDMERGVIKNCN